MPRRAITGAVPGTAPVARPGPVAPPARPGRARPWLPIAAALALLALLAAACSGGEDFDRDAAVRDLQARAGGLLSDEQAGCYVDRVVDEIGPRVLAPDAQPSDAELRRLTAIRVDCIGVSNLGLGPTTTGGTAPVELPPQPGPQTFGDDPALDALWSACEGGDGAACDELFDEAPLGSGYEAFGATCGGRGAELRCAEAYPALPSTSASTVDEASPGGE